eukprot:153131_1
MATELTEGQTNASVTSATASTVPNIDEWLKKSKIGANVIQIIKQKNISLEQLTSFNERELKQFGSDVLGLDTLSKHRFVQSIQKLNRINRPNPVTASTRQTIIVSSEEHEAVSSLYQTYTKASTAINNIQDAIETLNAFEWNDIEDTIDTIIHHVQSKRISVLDLIEEIQSHKLNTLNQQMSSIERYLQTLSNTKSKYDQYTKDPGTHHKERKKVILHMIKEVMDQSATTLRTAPNMRFDVEPHLAALNDTLDHMKVNDCDHPGKMDLKLKKLSFGAIHLEYALHECDIQSPKKIVQIVLEYAPVPKKYTPKRRKNDDSSSNDELTDVFVFDVKDIMDQDTDGLKWIANKNKIKYHRKRKGKNKYKIDDIKSFRGYLIRIRAQNESGWGPYSNILTAMTKECVKILKFSDTLRSKDGLIMKHHRKAVERTATGHKYILADTKPVFKGKHCWRVKVTNNKHWIFFGVSEKKAFDDSNYSKSYGCSGSSQYYKNDNSAVVSNGVKTAHLHTAAFVDILLDLNRRILCICEVGNSNDAKDAKLTNLPRTHGYVPAFNIHGQGIEIRLAKISASWYGKRKSIQFK